MSERRQHSLMARGEMVEKYDKVSRFRITGGETKEYVEMTDKSGARWL